MKKIYIYAKKGLPKMINILDFGVKGDGIANDQPAIQAALDFGEKDIVIPKGTYIVNDAIKIPSHRHIHADSDARIIFVYKRKPVQGDFLLTNSDEEDGNEDITVEGGVWDGGLGREFNVKPRDLYEIGAASCACLNFVTVKNLRLLNLTVANSMAFYIRLSRVRGFELKNIGLTSDTLGPNQDGIHFGGYCRDGVVENIRALVKGQTNDDLLAFNADDSLFRHENRGLACGPIENIVCKNIYAEDCHSAIRFASVTSPIKHIRIENITAGCRCNGINMDAARYCRTPLFKEESAPNGVGNVSDVKISDCTFYFTEGAFDSTNLIVAEEHCDGFEITNLRRPPEKDLRPEYPTVLARNLTHQKIVADGKETVLTEKSRECTIFGEISHLIFEKL
ncbi:MAG: hypothetical protein IJL30_01525 [Clostridia bacterium]|nr:hypothetical protein [Clostridia bacterium]